jgi:nitrate reductase gamma subunit/mono/diheme cytochrome c family protein
MFGGFMSCARARRAGLYAVIVVVAGLGTASAETAETKKLFTQKCMACHTFGKGVKVGPDLKGVTERRPRAWLVKFVRSSQSLIDAGDAVAVELFQQFKQQRMPDWADLTDIQISNLLDWLAINGPEQQEPDARNAELATAAEIETGRQLFHGDRRLARGGSACASCHAVRDAGGRSGGTLAGELTGAYSQYQDGAMTQFLKRPCVERIPESTTASFLAPEESFALKAYLRHAALTDQSARVGRTGSPLLAKSVDISDQQGAPADSVTDKAGAPTPRVLWAPRSTGSVPAMPGPRLDSELLFLAFPYVALLILMLGIAIRFAVTRRRRDSARSGAAAAWRLFRGGRAWRVGLAVTAALHMIGIVLPGTIVLWNGEPVRLYLLEGGGLLFGVVALLGWIQIMRRQLGGTIGRVRWSEIADCALLSLLGTAILSGLATALFHRWGSSWSASTLAPYMQSLASGTPATHLIEHMPFLVRLHVLSWFAVIALVPFTSTALIVVVALERGIAVLARPIDAATRAGRRVLARLSPARWLWPEEDALDLPGKSDNARGPS